MNRLSKDRDAFWFQHTNPATTIDSAGFIKACIQHLLIHRSVSVSSSGSVWKFSRFQHQGC